MCFLVEKRDFLTENSLFQNEGKCHYGGFWTVSGVGGIAKLDNCKGPPQGILRACKGKPARTPNPRKKQRSSKATKE